MQLKITDTAVRIDAPAPYDHQVGRLWTAHGAWFAQLFVKTYEAEEHWCAEEGGSYSDVPYFALAQQWYRSRAEMDAALAELEGGEQRNPYAPIALHYVDMTAKPDGEWDFRFARDLAAKAAKADELAAEAKAKLDKEAARAAREAERRYAPTESNLKIVDDGRRADAVIAAPDGAEHRVMGFEHFCQDYDHQHNPQLFGWYASRRGHRFADAAALKAWIIANVELFLWDERGENPGFCTRYRERTVPVDAERLVVDEAKWAARTGCADFLLRDGPAGFNPGAALLYIGGGEWGKKRHYHEDGDWEYAHDWERILPPFKRAVNDDSWVAGGVDGGREWLLENVKEVRVRPNGSVAAAMADGTVAEENG